MDIIDLYGAPEFFCQTLIKVEEAGPCRRLIFANMRNGVASAVLSIVIPNAAVNEALQLLHGEREAVQRSMLHCADIPATAN